MAFLIADHDEFCRCLWAWRQRHSWDPHGQCRYCQQWLRLPWIAELEALLAAQAAQLETVRQENEDLIEENNEFREHLLTQSSLVDALTKERDEALAEADRAQVMLVAGVHAEEKLLEEVVLQQQLLQTGLLSVWIPERGMLRLELGADLGNGSGFHRLTPVLREKVRDALASAIRENTPDYANSSALNIHPPPDGEP